MSMPNFLDKLKGHNLEKAKSFLALVLSDHSVQAAVWRVVEGKTEIISLGTPVEWDGEVATTSELISAVDATISSATEGGEGTEPDEIVLGLANNWVEPAGIKSSKKDLIKNIARELSLKPIGYVVLSDCLVRYLKMQEGTPPTSILIQVGRRQLSLSLVELGSIKHTVSVNLSDKLTSDVASALSQLPQGSPLPSRFILVSTMENSSELIAELTAYDYQKEFEFLHTPKVEALPKDVEVHATAVAGGTEVAAALGFSLDSPETTTELPSSASVLAEPLSPPTPSPSPLTAEEVGFAPVSSLQPDPVLPQSPEPEPNLNERTFTTPSSRFRLTLPKFKFPHLHLPHFSTPFRNTRSLVLIGVLILVLLGAGFIALYTLPRASVTLLVQAKPLTESLNLTLDPTATTLNVEDRILPARYQKETVSGSHSVPATGTKTIGDPARGEVTIYNRTTLSKTFLKGTTLNNGNLKFSLDSDVTIASKSAGVDYVDVPGKATVKITASSFGENANLSSGSEFTLASFSRDSYVAKNDAALTGGNSREVTVVSDADKKTLLESLTTTLRSDLSSSLALGITPPEAYYLLEDDLTIVKESYSAKVGEEATTLSGEVELTLGVLVYDTNQVKSLLENTISSIVPAGYLRADLPPDLNLTNAALKDDNVLTASAEVTLYVTPVLDFSNLQTLLKGKSVAAAKTTLTSLPGVVDTTIKLTPALPPRLLSLPLNPSHISFSISPTK